MSLLLQMFFGQLPKLKEGRQKVVSNDELFYSFVPEVSGTYQFNANRYFHYIITELEEDGKLSKDDKILHGDSVSVELKVGKKYVVCIYGETGLRGESLTIDRVPVVNSVEIASWSPENLTFTEGNDVSFHSINVRLNTDKGSEIVRLYGYNRLYGYTKDAYGNTVGYALGKLENDKLVGVNFADKDPLPAGEYAFQVFLTIGGATKFIPMTGVTLPLVSYGGSSIMCMILMIAIIQGLYIYREDEDEEIERHRREAAKRARQRAAEAAAERDY